MKDIKAILKDNGIEDDQVEKIAKDVIENYRSIDEVNRKASRIKELETEIESLQEKVKNSETDSETIESLKNQVAEFEQREQDRQNKEKEEAARNSFRETFNAAVGDKKFANDLMRETVFEKAYSMCGETSGLGAKDALEKITQNLQGVWINPQHDPAKMPGAKDVDDKTEEIATTKKAFAKQLFGGSRLDE